MIAAAAIILALACVGELAVSLYVRQNEYHPRNYNPPTVVRREP